MFITDVFTTVIGVLLHLYKRNTSIINFYGMENYFLNPERTRLSRRAMVPDSHLRQPRPLGLGRP